MITEKGYVYRKDGKYLRTSERHTHTGSHTTVDWVEYLDEATVYGYIPRWVKDHIQEAEKLPVQVERIVTLK